MARRNLYIRDQDEPLWKEAEAIAGDSLSSFVTEALQHWVGEKKRSAGGPKSDEELIKSGFYHVSLELRDGRYVNMDDDEFEDVVERRPVSFWGKTVAVHEYQFGPKDEPDKALRTTVYQTPKGSLLFYEQTYYLSRGVEQGTATYEVFGSLDEAVNAEVREHGEFLPRLSLPLLEKVAQGIGESWTRELDI